MKKTNRLLSCAIAAVVVMAFCDAGFASVILHDPTWEAPGGYVQTSSGQSPAHAGGTTWYYSQFDWTSYAALYYVIGDYDYDPGPPEVWTFNPEGPAIGTSVNGMTRLHYNASASDLAGGKVVWTGVIYIYDMGELYNRACDARFVLSVHDGEGDPVSLLDASTVAGMDTRVGGTHRITGDFSVNWLFELYAVGISDWSAAIPFFDGMHTHPSDSLTASVTRAFYYAPVEADINQDGRVDLADFAEFQRCFGATSPFSGGCELADLNYSDSVDLMDLALFEPAMSGPVAK